MVAVKGKEKMCGVCLEWYKEEKARKFLICPVCWEINRMGKAELVGWLVGYIKSHGWARVAEKCELREDYLHKFLTTDTAWYSRQKYRHKVIRGIRRLSKDSLGGLGELQAMQAGVGIKCDICEGGEGVRVKVGKEQTGARTLCKKCGEKYAFL